jgi:hypothetical protein
MLYFCKDNKVFTGPGRLKQFDVHMLLKRITQTTIYGRIQQSTETVKRLLKTRPESTVKSCRQGGLTDCSKFERPENLQYNRFSGSCKGVIRIAGRRAIQRVSRGNQQAGV